MTASQGSVFAFSSARALSPGMYSTLRRGRKLMGPVAAREIERRAVDAGLLDEGKPLAKSKVFRTARKSLGIKTYQRPGKRSGGWIWALPDQATADTLPAAHLGP
jgi:hypothetical protein